MTQVSFSCQTDVLTFDFSADYWLNFPGCALLRRLWFCVTTHLNALNLQIVKTSAFIEALKLADDQLIKCISLSASDACYPLNSLWK